MNDFNLYTPTEIIFGRDTELKTGQTVRRHQASRVLVVCGGQSARRSGLLGRIERNLDEAGIAHTLLDGIHPNPLDDKVYEGIDLCRRHSIEMILAVGGGSAIDTAKAIAVGAPYDGDFWDFFAGTARAQTALPIGVVLTIPAAGSEGSGNSVITRRSGLLKLGIRYHRLLRPRFAIMNPELTFTLPPFQTACGIVDMMVHILERYFTNTAGVDLTDRLCEGLLTSIMAQADAVMTDPADYDARANIMLAGTLAHNGLCGVGREEDWATHYMEHELSALYDVAHGAGLAVMLPAWMTFVAPRNPGRLAQLGRRVFGISPTLDATAAAQQTTLEMKRFFGRLGMPANFADIGADPADIDTLVGKLHTNKGETVGFYCRLDRAATREIFTIAAHQ